MSSQQQVARMLALSLVQQPAAAPRSCAFASPALLP